MFPCISSFLGAALLLGAHGLHAQVSAWRQRVSLGFLIKGQKSEAENRLFCSDLQFSVQAQTRQKEKAAPEVLKGESPTEALKGRSSSSFVSKERKGLGITQTFAPAKLISGVYSLEHIWEGRRGGEWHGSNAADPC